MNKPKLLILTGPTATGKTAVSLLAAKRLNAEIVSADSMQVYKGLNIGTAKPTISERQGVVHHMIDVVDVTDTTFSVASFKHEAQSCISSILLRGKTPLVVGGTGLYINALTYPMRFAAPANTILRDKLRMQEDETPGVLYKQLEQVDAVTAARLHPNDIRRIIRALEVHSTTGQPFSSFYTDITQTNNKSMYHPIIIGLTKPRALLYSDINSRVDTMMEAGLLEEVKSIYDAGFSHSLPALQGLGYKQLLMYMCGEISIEEAIERIKRETRRFAKRQLTWFRHDARLHWLDTTEYQSPQALTNAVIKIFNKDNGEGESQNDKREPTGQHP